MEFTEKKINIPIRKVIKLGGSCLVDAASLRLSLSLLKKEPPKVAVVVSALKGVTDLLLEAYYAALSQTRDFNGVVATIRKRHEKIAFKIIPSPWIDDFQKKFQEILNLLTFWLKKIFENRQTTQDLKAKILSIGERLSAYLLSAALEAEGLKSKVYETDKIGLIVLNELGRAWVDLEKFEANFEKIAEEIDEGNFLPIFTGLFGSNESGEVILLGRNSSDYSAAVIARGLKASVLELYKDVRGMMTADPYLIPEARLIPYLSRQEAAALAFYGAKIIHPNFWHPLVGVETQVVIKNFHQADAAGTIISSAKIKPIKNNHADEKDEKMETIKGISCKENITLLRIELQSPSGLSSILSKIESAIAERNGQIIAIFPQSRGFSLLISDISPESLREIGSILGQKLYVERNLALIAVIGQGIDQNPRLIPQIFWLLNEEKITPYFSLTLPIEEVLLLVLKRQELLSALRKLHRTLIDKNYKEQKLFLS